MQTIWFAVLMCAVCLEGLGRRYLPFLPQATFYFMKDVVLLFGLIQFRPNAEIRNAARQLFRGFDKIVAVAFLWTLAEIFNPDQQSVILGFIGLRSYWLWWLAPLVIASALRQTRHKERAIYSLLAIAACVSAMAALQFASPPDSSANMYSVWNGEEVYASDIAVVSSTGRARVASTFAFVSGFVDFTILVPALLMSLGLDSTKPAVRRAALLGTLISAAVVPMSGSRSSVVIGVAVLAVALWSAGLFFTRVGRRILIGAAVAGVLAVAAFPDAFAGVQSRFEENREESVSRVSEMANVFPPLALAVYEYPVLGIGTGMQQNARATFRVYSRWDTEPELGRYLVELGPVGFILIWLTKLGLMVALLRAYALLKRAGRRGSAAAALSYAALTMVGSLAFDHNWQSLYFTGCGFILSEVLAVKQRASAAHAAADATPALAAGATGYQAA